MNKLWAIRKYKEGDEKGLVQLIKLVYEKETEQAMSDWIWYYRNNPFGHFIGIAEHDGQIIGHMALIPIYMKVGEKTKKSSQAVDLAVHPDFRHQGIFLAIGEYLTNEAGKEGMDFSYGFPNKPAHSGHLKYGFFDVCFVPTLSKILSGSTLLNTSTVNNFLGKFRIAKSLMHRYKILEKIMKFLFGAILTTMNLYHKVFYRLKGNVKLNTLKVEAITSFDGRINDLWRIASSSYSIIVVRDKKYLNWRYFGNPNLKYRVLIAEKNCRILGYIVLSTVRSKTNQGLIVDLLTLPDNGGIAQLLISKAVEYFRKRNFDSVICYMLGSDSYYRALRNNAFIPLAKKILIARVNSSRISEEVLRDYRNWYLTIGDVL